jgi:hypothetical protein
MATNRNFDSRVVIQRLQDKVIANNIYRSQKNGKTILRNPQNSNPSGQIIVDYEEGVQTTYEQGPNGGYTVDLGGIADQLNTIQPVKPILPSPPTNLIANPGDQIATIFFTPGSQGSSPITNYEYSIDGGITFVAFSPAQTTSPVTISGLTNGTQYIVALKAVTSVGSSSSSLTTNVTPATIPTAPTNLSVVPGNSQVTITFTQTSDGGSAITDYQYSTNGGSSWNFIGATSSPVIITGLTNGTTYSIQLRALNAIGPSDSSSGVTIVPIPSTSFSPATIGYRNLWINPQDSSSITVTSGKVSTAKDVSVNNNDFTASASGTILYAQPSNINNRPALNFTTSAPSLSTYLGKDNFNIAPTNELTLFMVVNQTGNGSGNSELFFTRNDFRYLDLFNNTNFNNLLSVNVGGDTQQSTGQNIINTSAVISLVLTTTTVTIYVNGILTSVNGTARQNVGSYGSLNNAILDWAISGGAFLGNIGDVLTYAQPFDQTNRQNVEGYMAWKWGLQSQLPIDHPWKNLPPTGDSYIINTYTTVGTTTWTAPEGVTSIDYTIIGGGGGGGGAYDTGGGGGGGGGMVLTGTYSVTPGQTYTIVVGDGGARSTNSYPTINETDGGSGGDSSFDTIIALGGEGGKRSRFQAGGSGAGGAAQDGSTTSARGGMGGGSNGGGGGGGGATTSGGNKSGSTAGGGGSGLASLLSGFTETYGVGGSGGNGGSFSTGADAVPTTGNGANGAGASSGGARNGGKGGSGIIIIKYLPEQVLLRFDPTNSACYPGTGTTITSVGSSNITGTMTNVTWTSDPQVGYYFNFNGSSYITFPNFNFGTNITVVAWIKASSKLSINSLLANETSGNNSTLDGFKLGWNSWNSENRHLIFEGKGGGASNGSSIITYGSWQQIVYVLNNDTSTISFYNNGTQTGTQSSIPSAINMNTTKGFKIGAFTDSSYTMNAQLGDLRVYPSALDSTQILSIYNSTKSRFGL